MKLVHYSDKPVGALRNPERSRAVCIKPNGFWVSDDDCEDSWPAWCVSQSFRLNDLSHAHDVVLRPDAHVLTVATAAELDAVTREYGWRRPPFDTIDFTFMLDWPRMAERYQALIITPHIKGHLDYDGDCPMWYSGWDCASGCIWDVGAIAAITLRRVGASTLTGR